MTDEELMREAIRLSARAIEHGNEPFGAVLAHGGEVVCTCENQIHSRHDRTSHAEMGLIRRFIAETGHDDLSAYTLYSSCEPCFMCSGAMVWTHLGRLVFAASNHDLRQLRGRVGSPCSSIVFAHSSWQPQVSAGLLRDEAIGVLASYFTKRTQ